MQSEQENSQGTPPGSRKAAGSFPFKSSIAVALTSLSALSFVFSGRGCGSSEKQIDPAAAHQIVRQNLCLSERFCADLKFLDSGLMDIRYDHVWRDHPHKKAPDLSYSAVASAVRNFDHIREETKDDPYFSRMTGDIERLEGHLANIMRVRLLIEQGQTLQKEDYTGFQESRAFVKGMLRRIDAYTEAMEEKGLDPKIGAPDLRSPYLPIISDVCDPLPQGSVCIPQGISEVLMKLWHFTSDHRILMNKGISDDDTTRVVRVREIKEPGSEDPVFLVDIESLVDVRGEQHTVLLHFKQTIERVDTVGTALGVKSGGGIVVRNRLMQEADINGNLGICDYNTCLTYFAADGADAGKTRLSFTADMGLVFYEANSRSLMSTAFRAGARKKSEWQLWRKKDQTLERAEKLFKAVFEEGADKALRHIELPVKD